jgi:RecB family endonuclease NucS
MLCKVCNTRIARGRTNCPNCGSNSILEPVEPKSHENAALPQIDYSAIPKSESTEPDEAVELDVPAEVAEMKDETIEVELDEPAGVSGSGASTSEDENVPPDVLDLTETPEANGFVSPDPAAIRAALGEQPALLESGLSIYTSEKGTPLGVGYTSAVGEIDLLAWDAQGGLVVVMIADTEDGPELISGVLQRIGWVSKHLCGADQSVRGIVLLESMPEALTYAAAAVAETISFKTWRVALIFSDIDV